MTNKETLEMLKLCFSSIAIMVIVKSLTRVRLFATPWTIADQVPLSMGFSRQEYWSGLPLKGLGGDKSPGRSQESSLRLTRTQMAGLRGKQKLRGG